MPLSADELRQLTTHVQVAKKALQRLPRSQVTTDALATVEDVAEFASSPHADPLPGLSAATTAADDLATFAITQSGQAVRGDVDAVIKQLRKVADLLRKANER